MPELAGRHQRSAIWRLAPLFDHNDEFLSWVSAEPRFSKSFLFLLEKRKVTCSLVTNEMFIVADSDTHALSDSLFDDNDNFLSSFLLKRRYP